MVAKSVTSKVTNDAGGLSLVKSGLNNPNPIQHGSMGQAERAFSAGSTFLSGLLAISASQFIGAPLKLIDAKFYDEYMAWTKQSFAVLVTTITQWWSPTVIRVSGDDSMKGQLYQMEDGTLRCNFPHRLVLMANHQLYTDWLYLWWIAYTNKMHGRIYIILKESLKQLPIFGWGAQFYNFIFLSRNWETDKWRFKRALNHFRNPDDPMWLLIFPEGTNLSAVTREKSAAWAKKSGIPDMKHQLLPRSTGLKFCLSELKNSTNWLYDCTIAYEGVPEGMYGQDIFTLRSSFFEGRPPKSVNMFWRRYKISEIPLENDAAFGRWLNNRWREKDYMLEYFDQYKHFPADDPVKALGAAARTKTPNHANAISTEVKAGGWDEFLSIFGPITTAAGALQAVDLTEPLNLDALLMKVAEQQNLNLLNIGKMPIAATSQEAIKNALTAAQKKSGALPQPVIDYLMRSIPQTQQQMQQTLVKAGARTGYPDIAKKAGKSSSVPAQLTSKTQGNVTRAAAQTPPVNRSVADGQKSKMPIVSPTLVMRSAMPLANLETMVTRPLSTLALQTAAASVASAASRRTTLNGAALAGEKAKSVELKPKANATNRSNGVMRSSAGTSTASKKPLPLKTIPSKSRGPPRTVPLTTANLHKSTAKHKPMGTTKYANSKATSG